MALVVNTEKAMTPHSSTLAWKIPWTTAHQALHPWDFPGKSTGVGCHCLLRRETVDTSNSTISHRQLYQSPSPGDMKPPVS